jgi:hypothetical protein
MSRNATLAHRAAAIGLSMSVLLAASAGHATARTIAEELTANAKSFVRIGISRGEGNFAAIRGAQVGETINKTTDFHVTMSFGETLGGCRIVAFGEPNDLWELTCTTGTFNVSKEKMLGLLRPAIQAALPDDFSVTTDPSFLIANDYRWERRSDNLSVELSCTSDNGTFCTVGVTHDLSR